MEESPEYGKGHIHRDTACYAVFISVHIIALMAFTFLISRSIRWAVVSASYPSRVLPHSQHPRLFMLRRTINLENPSPVWAGNDETWNRLFCFWPLPVFSTRSSSSYHRPLHIISVLTWLALISFPIRVLGLGGMFDIYLVC
jgi:hypothetical protein